MKSRERAKAKIIEYLANPENPPLPWVKLCTEVCRYKSERYLFEMFTPDERREIEYEALDLRRKNYGRYLMAVDAGLIKSASKGDPKAAKLAYQRFEGWAERHEVTGQGGESLQITIVPAKGTGGETENAD